jgi:hypothetical protein
MLGEVEALRRASEPPAEILSEAKDLGISAQREAEAPPKNFIKILKLA